MILSWKIGLSQIHYKVSENQKKELVFLQWKWKTLERVRLVGLKNYVLLNGRWAVQETHD